MGGLGSVMHQKGRVFFLLAYWYAGRVPLGMACPSRRFEYVVVVGGELENYCIVGAEYWRSLSLLFLERRWWEDGKRSRVSLDILAGSSRFNYLYFII